MSPKNQSSPPTTITTTATTMIMIMARQRRSLLPADVDLRLLALAPRARRPGAVPDRSTPKEFATAPDRTIDPLHRRNFFQLMAPRWRSPVLAHAATRRKRSSARAPPRGSGPGRHAALRRPRSSSVALATRSSHLVRGSPIKVDGNPSTHSRAAASCRAPRGTREPRRSRRHRSSTSTIRIARSP